MQGKETENLIQMKNMYRVAPAILMNDEDAAELEAGHPVPLAVDAAGNTRVLGGSEERSYHF